MEIVLSMSVRMQCKSQELIISMRASANYSFSRAFRSGVAPILVATGVSARGWDVMGIEHVINFDLPKVEHGGIQEYIHRIGRTARIGHRGLATSFYNDRDEGLAQALVNILVECDCEVPDFLAQYTPGDGKIDFDDDSDDGKAEDEDNGGVSTSFGDNSGGEALNLWGTAAPDVAAAPNEGFVESVGAPAAASAW